MLAKRFRRYAGLVALIGALIVFIIATLAINIYINHKSRGDKFNNRDLHNDLEDLCKNNIGDINKKTGGEHNAGYLAYALEYVLNSGG